jgi:hypothetical protein
MTWNVNPMLAWIGRAIYSSQFESNLVVVTRLDRLNLTIGFRTIVERAKKKRKHDFPPALPGKTTKETETDSRSRLCARVSPNIASETLSKRDPPMHHYAYKLLSRQNDQNARELFNYSGRIPIALVVFTRRS